MAKSPFTYTPTIIFVALAALMIIYIIMVYPSERAALLSYDDAKTNTVTIKDLQFNPQLLTVTAGTTVMWKNQDPTRHKLNFGDFGSDVLDPGESYSHKFDKTGTYVYSCEFHTSMKGTIEVTG